MGSSIPCLNYPHSHSLTLLGECSIAQQFPATHWLEIDLHVDAIEQWTRDPPQVPAARSRATAAALFRPGHLGARTRVRGQDQGELGRERRDDTQSGHHDLTGF